MHLNHPSLTFKRTLSIKQAGVSLLEFVLGLVLLSIVLVGVTLFYANQHRQLDPVFQFRAVSLVEAVVEQMLVVKYDANNNPYQQVRCGLNAENNQPAPPACTTNNNPTATSKNINEFKVLDDFNQWCDTRSGGSPINAQQLVNDLNMPHSHLYQGIMLASCVSSATDTTGTVFKQVTIRVKIKQGGDITFSLRRYNIL